MADAIVTDGFWRKSLSAIRSLGKADIRVHVVGDSFLSTGFWSKFCSEKLVTTDPVVNPTKFGIELIEYLEGPVFDEPPVLFPMEDETLRWVSEQRAKLKSLAHFLIPSEAALEIAWNKGKTALFAEGIGINTPKTYRFENYAEFSDKISELIDAGRIESYVIKPVTGSSSIGMLYPTFKLDPSALEGHWKSHGKLLIQKRLPRRGAAICVSLLFDRASVCVAHFVHKRLAEYPNSGGPSTSRMSIHAETIVEKSVKLLSSMKWIGIAMVEWKIDSDDGLPYLLEINPRFWGGLELAIRAGVNFPVLYFRLCCNLPVGHNPKYLEGIVSRWVIPGEVLRYISAPREEREDILTFMSGLPGQADEWDVQDINGTFASIICPMLSLFRIKYWKFLLR